MNKKRVLVLDQELLEQIDASRGDLNRDDFISFCVESVFGAEAGAEPEIRVKTPVAARTRVEPVVQPAASVEYASREEFLELKQSITSLMRTFLDFFINFGVGIEPVPAKNTIDIEKLRSQLRKVMEEK